MAGFSVDEDAETTYDDARSPLARKSRSGAKKGSSTIGLLDKDFDIDEVDADETMTAGADSDEDEDEDEEGEEIELSCGTDDDDEEEWVPEEEPRSTPKGKGTKDTNKSSKPRSTSGVTKLQKKMHELSLYADDGDDEEEGVEVVAAPKARRYVNFPFFRYNTNPRYPRRQTADKKEPSKSARRSTRQKMN